MLKDDNILEKEDLRKLECLEAFISSIEASQDGAAKKKRQQCTQDCEQKAENMDSIANVIQMSNRIVNWMAECVLSKADARERATIVKNFINVAQQNFTSSLLALENARQLQAFFFGDTVHHESNRGHAVKQACELHKRWKTFEVVIDKKRWQAQPFNLQLLSSIQTWIEESSGRFNDIKAWREREDEKMARLLQESGSFSL
ncbi:hypothetical protein C0995_000157 [Termitomyces sp. Mi166|nr:hypothetical protein C0995_000157 [Termitomyces sp. Mi166\